MIGGIFYRYVAISDVEYNNIENNDNNEDRYIVVLINRLLKLDVSLTNFIVIGRFLNISKFIYNLTKLG